MEGLFRNILYQTKNTYRNKSYFFWVVLYPIVLAAFFYAAFNGMMDIELEDINVGIVEDNPISFILEEIDLLNVEKVREGEIEEKIENEEIDVFIDNDLNLLVKKSGIKQTIVKEIVEQIKQMVKLNRPMDSYDFSIDYTISKNQQANPMIIIFYSLIAMVSAYGVFSGIESVYYIQANLSNIGVRINATPLKKSNFLVAGIIVALVLNLISNFLLIIFIQYVLKLHLFHEIKYSTIFILLGNLFGVLLGVLIGVSNKLNPNTKTALGIIVLLFLSFLSGMMSPDIKIIIESKFPIISRINPINIITSNLYRINLLGNTRFVNEGMIILSIYCMVLVIISYFFLRRRTYDSI
ncbi:MAG TPA: ABC transporter permease [Tissierellaceae bacterium]